MQKKCAIGETECNEILSLYLRKTENLSKEKEGMGERERGLKKGAERKEKRQKGAELFEEEDREHRHLPLLVVQLPQGAEFPTRFCSKALQH